MLEVRKTYDTVVIQLLIEKCPRLLGPRLDQAWGVGDQTGHSRQGTARRLPDGEGPIGLFGCFTNKEMLNNVIKILISFRLLTECTVLMANIWLVGNGVCVT